MSESNTYTTILGRNPRLKKPTRIKPYDFTRPDKFSREQLRTIEIIHNAFSQKLDTLLTKTFMENVSVDIDIIDQMTFREAMDDMPAIAGHFIYMLSPLKGSAIVELDHELTQYCISSMCGGSGTPTVVDRQLTKLEQRITMELGRDISGILNESWYGVLPLQSRLLALETQTRFAQIVPPTEMIIYVGLTVRIGERSHMVRCMYPYLTIEPIIGRLTPKYWYSNTVIQKGTNNLGIADDLEVEGSLRLTAEALNLSEIGNLAVGDVLHISTEMLENPVLHINGSPYLETTWKEPDFSSPTVLTPHSESNMDADERMLERFQKTIMEGIMAAMDEKLGNIPGISEASRKQKQSISDLEPADFIETQQTHSHLRASEPEDPETFLQSLIVDQGESLYITLNREHPQLQAAVVSRLSTALSADYICRMPPALRNDLLSRVASIGQLSPVVPDIISIHISAELKTMEFTHIGGGADRIAEILNYVPASVEREVLTAWDSSDPNMSSEIKKRMFVFDDLVLVDAESVQTLFKRCDTQTFATAIKQISEEALQHVKDSLTETQWALLDAQNQKRGEVSVRIIEDAQLQVIEQLKELDYDGEVTIRRFTDEV